MLILEKARKVNMLDMEKASDYLAAKISVTLNFDKDFEEVLAYGAFAILQTFWSIILTLIFGIIFKVPLEAIVISFSAAILRKYSGGIHATTPNRCAVIATIIFVTIAVCISQLIKLNIIASILYYCSSFFLAYYIVYTKAPKDTPNKPITDEAIKKHLRNNAIKTIYVFLTISLILSFIYADRKSVV